MVNMPSTKGANSTASNTNGVHSPIVDDGNSSASLSQRILNENGLGASMEEETRLDVVQLDALVVLKLIKHCREGLPKLVTGQLLGLDVENKLEITNCFPFPTDSNTASDEGTDYQLEMMKCLRDVNVDHNTVGWYSSTFLGSYVNTTLIETQFNYQQSIGKSVVLVYDPSISTSGDLALKAFRLTPTFMEFHRDNKFTSESLLESNLTFNDMLEELPIQIHNSSLVNAFLMQLQDESDDLFPSFDNLKLSKNTYLEKNIEYIIDSIDDYQSEQNKFQYYQRNVTRQQSQIQQYIQRKKLEKPDAVISKEDIMAQFKPIQEPPRLDNLLIMKQMHTFCKQINGHASTNFGKLFAIKEMQKGSSNSSMQQGIDIINESYD